MNVEASRLRTFRHWPANAVVDARRIAKAGFYYMGREQEVQCFSCGGRISEWNYGDKVMTKHRRLDPRCPFVVCPAGSGNIPIESDGSTSTSNRNDSDNNSNSISQSDRAFSPQVSVEPILAPPPPRRSTSELSNSVYQQSEAARLETFNNWPKPYIVTAESLARAGFYYTQDNDTVSCPFCNILVGHWEAGDDPTVEHLRHNASCWFFIEALQSNSGDSEMTEPVIADSSYDGINVRQVIDNCNGDSVTMQELGVQSHTPPKHPKYSVLEARLQTYINWPGDVFQTPDDLAAAGFYYAGSGDQVKCFHCDGGLRMWDPEDDPWIEHARWYPLCGYIIIVKGQPYVDGVLRDYPPLDADELAQLEQVKVSKQGNSARPLVPITESELQDLMTSPEAVTALQVGIEQSRVKLALRQRAESGGQPFSSSEALINAALDVQLAEPDADAWSTPPNSPVRYHRVVPEVLSESDEVATDPEDAVGFSITAGSAGREPEVVVLVPEEEEEEIDDEFVSNEEGDDASTIPADTGDNASALQPCEENGIRKISLEEENRRLKEARLCKICMDKEISIVFLPCGHLVTCVQCAPSLTDCPVCRKEIKATVRTFLS